MLNIALKSSVCKLLEKEFAGAFFARIKNYYCPLNRKVVSPTP